MKGLFIIPSLLAPVSAFPADSPSVVSTGPTPNSGIADITKTIDLSHNLENALDGECPQIIAVIARATIEGGNVGITLGPSLCRQLKEHYGNKFGCQGLDPKKYSGGVMDNLNAKGTSESAIEEGIYVLTKARTKCPKSVIVPEGFSQGAALMHNAIPGLKPEIRDSITAGVLFGDPKVKTSGGGIKDWPADKLRIYCAKEDGICTNGKSASVAHVAYLVNGDDKRAANWLIEKIDAALGKGFRYRRLVSHPR